jgi:hypothetical protein
MTSLPLSSFRKIIIEFDSMKPATDNVNLQVLVSTNGGSSYDNAAASYMYTNVGTTGTSTLNLSSNSSVNIQCNVNSGAGIGNTFGADWRFELHNPSDTANRPHLSWTYSARDMLSGNHQALVGMGSGTRLTAQDTDALRFLWSSGNTNATSAGNYYVYGQN